MSARERNRYITVAIVFLTAFIVLGLLMVRTARVMAQSFTFRPQAGVSNTYSVGPSTQNLGLAFDPNTSTAATTYTNADFSDDGAAADDLPPTWSGRWAAFDQTTTFIRDVGLYVIREGIDNSVVDQWVIEYSIDGISGTWITLDSPAISGDNPANDEVDTFALSPDVIPNDTDLQCDLAVRTTSRQIDSDDAKLNIFDIRVEAQWDSTGGGAYPLRIDSPVTLDDGIKDAVYALVTFVASGGNLPYDWCFVGDALPADLRFNPVVPECPSSVQIPTVDLSDPPLFDTPTVGGTFNFTIRVTDNSTTTQVAERDYSLRIFGLAIAPPGPNLTGWPLPMVVDLSGSQTFTPSGGTAPYSWCLVSGSIPPGVTLRNPTSQDVPPCSSTPVSGATISLSGAPTQPGVYSFTIRLSDSGGETPVDHHYVADVGSDHVIVLKRLLRPVIKEIAYGAQMTPQYLQAINVTYASAASEVYWSPSGSPGLPTGFSLIGTTLNTVANTSSVYIGGTIPVPTSAGQYDFTATADDNGQAQDSEAFELEVMERVTLLRRTPPSAVALPNDHSLDFVVFASGGAPSKDDDSELDGASVPYYNYFWLVTAQEGSTPLKDVDGSRYHVPAAADRTPGPDLLEIIFIDANDQPVTGTYSVTFWAQDWLGRDNAPNADGDPTNHPDGIDTNDPYEFVPATARIMIMSPAGRTLEKDTTRPMLMRQEQFR